jgi:monothiol glutaredoxin
MVEASDETSCAPPSDRVILYALEPSKSDRARETLLELCSRHGCSPFVVDAGRDPIFAEHVKTPSTRAHFPLLCVRGLLVGGLDDIQNLEDEGKLGQLLSGANSARIPNIALSQRAAEVIEGALNGPETCLRIIINEEYEHEITIDAFNQGDIQFNLGVIPCVLDPESAERAFGLAIDWIDDDNTQGFRIDNPNRPEPVNLVNRQWLENHLLHRSNLVVIDVRSKAEYDVEHLPNAQYLDATLIDELEKTGRYTPLFFYCKNGVKSRLAAERFRQQGFLTVYCLTGGLDALNDSE